MPSTSKPRRLTIQLSEMAERPFLSLAPAVRNELQRIIEGIAELAAVAPPIDPRWLRLPHFRPPVLRCSYADVDVFYEIDMTQRALRVTSVRRADRLDMAG